MKVEAKPCDDTRRILTKRGRSLICSANYCASDESQVYTCFAGVSTFGILHGDFYGPK
jgi:hypothetical protein